MFPASSSIFHHFAMFHYFASLFITFFILHHVHHPSLLSIMLFCPCLSLFYLLIKCLYHFLVFSSVFPIFHHVSIMCHYVLPSSHLFLHVHHVPFFFIVLRYSLLCSTISPSSLLCFYHFLSFACFLNFSLF